MQKYNMTKNKAKYKKILLLGGTQEAYKLAQLFFKNHLDFLSSLAGRTVHPRLPDGNYRIGGFGGRDGLINFVQSENIGVIIDATHPFAQTISEHAVQAANFTNISYIRLERQPWQPVKGDNWHVVYNLEEAAQKIPFQSKCFLAIGRQYLHSFLKRKDVSFIARMVDQFNDKASHDNLHIILEKPGSYESEKLFLMKHNFDSIICRNSGGIASYAKIKAARFLNIPVIMIHKFLQTNTQSYSSVEEVLAFVRKYAASSL
ncbi:cobalt-precorrin-6A reductase [Bartonella tamiae]|uniref:cobalt-precorrin-6A reductase n=1 Tax=Bartonella tamiae TaxID=373638 RepID=UPI001FDA723A|nr:cobalt-precorrin-6A reductase [Bartonella tamiae]